MKKCISGALAAAAVMLTGAGSDASGAACSNSCVTMAIPAADGVHTRLDGTADAVLWPPTRELRTIRISALNERGAGCDVTIDDVRQDEAPVLAGSGATIDDAVLCDNQGLESSVRLRSARAENGDGRGYRISYRMEDPACGGQARIDEVLVAVPREQTTTSLESMVDENTLTASYSGTALQCSPPQRDARLR
jgi:hypothetical protein